MLPESEIKQIREYLATDFEHGLFEATLKQVLRDDDPLRANNFAYALRELSRHVLARLSPDSDVREAPWYVEEKNDRDEVVITRHQRMKFAIQGFLEDAFLTETLEIDYKSEIKTLKDEIGKLSKYTHVQPETFNVGPEVVEALCKGALSALAELFRSMFDCRERTLEAVADHVDEAVISHVVEETLEGFYDFATHYATDEVIVDSLECTGFQGDEIYGSVSGTVSVTLQYGSSGDRARGDGAEMDASAEFTCDVALLASDLGSISIVDGTFKMDYDDLEKSWRDDGDDDF